MANVTVTTDIDNLLKSADNAAARTNLGIGTHEPQRDCTAPKIYWHSFARPLHDREEFVAQHCNQQTRLLIPLQLTERPR